MPLTFSGNSSAISSYPRFANPLTAPSPSTTTPALAPLTTQSSFQDVFAQLSTLHYNLTTAIPVQVFDRRFVHSAAATVSPKIR